MSGPPDKRFVPDARVQESIAMLPTDRPPTKREVWDYISFLYHDIKTAGELGDFAHELWAWRYFEWIRDKDWNKQPDWKPGDEVIRSAVPSFADFTAGHPAHFADVVDRAYTHAQRRAA